jgi:hypothetical protein
MQIVDPAGVENCVGSRPLNFSSLGKRIGYGKRHSRRIRKFTTGHVTGKTLNHDLSRLIAVVIRRITLAG